MNNRTTHVAESLSPSRSPPDLGFVADDGRGPLLLGKGFGPKAYRDILEIWAIISAEQLESIDKSQISCVRSLLRRMNVCDPTVHHEGVFSGIISGMIQKFVSLFGATSSKFAVIHQTFVQNTTGSSVDIALTDISNDSFALHALMEAKWPLEKDKFPEAQACAYACWFSKNSDGNPQFWWLPVFVLTRTSYRFGVAFSLIGRRWAYSEIFEYRANRGNFDPANDIDVLRLVQFCKFFLMAADFHSSYTHRPNENYLVDKTGRKLLDGHGVLSGRVLMGCHQEINKVLKFFASRKAAEMSIKNQNDISRVLKRAMDAELREGDGSSRVEVPDTVSKNENSAELCFGCCADEENQLCAVMEDYIDETEEITFKHLINLTKVVNCMHSSGFVHGDLRAQNIRFGKDGKVTLIDFEFAGIAGDVLFPDNVNIDAYGLCAQKFITPGTQIPSKFDWHCLEDLLDSIGCSAAAIHAHSCNFAEVLSVLWPFRNAVIDETKKTKLRPGNRHVLLNFKQLGSRLSDFYSKEIPARARKRKADGSSKEESSSGRT
jgi:hypothetical protein